VITEARLSAGETATVQLRLRPVMITEPMTVTATVLGRLQRTPGGIAEVPQAELRRSRAGHLKDVLQFTPGVLAQSRFGADETQLSIRGSGLRNNFHMRGLNLLINGLPYMEADGFTDFESIELLTTQRIEVWKGANAVQYGGNSSGGAINFVTYTGSTASPFELATQAGSFGYFKGQLASGGVRGPLDYYVSATSVALDGYREHSRQERERVFGNLGWSLDPRTDLKLDLLYAHVVERLPGALTKAQLRDDPEQADPNNVANDWGRDYDFYRVGAKAVRRWGSSRWASANVFAQYRDMVHPIFQVLDQDQRSYGAEAAFHLDGSLLGRPARTASGLSGQLGNVDEVRFANQNGARGALVNAWGADARNLGMFVDHQVDLGETVTLATALRADWAVRPYEDRFPGDGDRSAERHYRAFSPKLGLMWRPSASASLFANASRAYEPPLTLELTSFGAPGFLDLAAQDTWQFEVGSRGRLSDRLGWDVALYDAEIRDELLNLNVRPFPNAPFTVPSFRNLDRTRHRGIELGLDASAPLHLLGRGDRVSGRLAYTLGDFRFVNDPAFGDNRLPGSPVHLVRWEARFESASGFWIAPSVDWSPWSYPVNSANTEENDPYSITNLKVGWARAGLTAFAQVDNLTDRRYASAVQVDNAVGRFYEPGAGRSFSGGLRWAWGRS
jgi:iron complex outermembrane receptor protein